MNFVDKDGTLKCTYLSTLGQFDEHRPSWFFKQRDLNQAITITLQLTEHAINFLNTCLLVVFSHLSLHNLFFLVQGASNVSLLQLSDRSIILNILNYRCRCIVTWHLLVANSKLAENFQPSSEYSLQWR